MRRFTFFGTVRYVLIATLTFSSCGKNNSPGGGSVNPAVLRPATMKFYEGPIGTLGRVWTYEYDSDNLLTKFGEEGKQLRIVTPGLSQLKLFYENTESTTNYVYNPGTLHFNIYDPKNQPAVVSVQTSILNLVYNQITQPPVYEWRFGYNADFQVVQDVTAVGKGLTIDYRYDDNKNLKKIEFSSMLDGHWTIYNRTTVTGYDDKHSPFSAVKGYRWASFPQNYNEQFAQAFCSHNPTQMKSEFYSITRNVYYLAEQTDFDYTYNEQGYPVKIVVKTTYSPETGPGGSSVKTYEFTYK